MIFRSTLYDLGDNGWTRIFYHLAKTNKREKMFNVQGSHTFFLPVDAAFDVSIKHTTFSCCKIYFYAVHCYNT